MNRRCRNLPGFLWAQGSLCISESRNRSSGMQSQTSLAEPQPPCSPHCVTLEGASLSPSGKRGAGLVSGFLYLTGPSLYCLLYALKMKFVDNGTH